MNSTNFLFSAICRVFKDYLENEYCGLPVGQGVSRFLGQIRFLYNVFEYGKTYFFMTMYELLCLFGISKLSILNETSCQM